MKGLCAPAGASPHCRVGVWVPGSWSPLCPHPFHFLSGFFALAYSFSVSVPSLSSLYPLPFLQSPLFEQILWFADCGRLLQRRLQKWLFKAHGFQYFRLRWSPQTQLPWRRKPGRRRAPEPACPFSQREGHVVAGVQVDMGPQHCFVFSLPGEQTHFANGFRWWCCAIYLKQFPTCLGRSLASHAIW